MANKKTQKRNKKRKQEQMRAAADPAAQAKPARKPINWMKVIGAILVVVLVVGAGVAKVLYDKNLTDSASQTAEATA